MISPAASACFSASEVGDEARSESPAAKATVGLRCHKTIRCDMSCRIRCDRRWSTRLTATTAISSEGTSEASESASSANSRANQSCCCCIGVNGACCGIGNAAVDAVDHRVAAIRAPLGPQAPYPQRAAGPRD